MISRNQIIISSLLLIVSINFAGCSGTKLLGGVNEKGERIFLTSADQIANSIERFFQSQDITNEESRINYLLYRIEKSNLTFVRNRAPYASSDAANFLRWKLNRPRWRPLVKTAREFIVIITSGSVTSSQPYHIAFPNSKFHHELKPILINELDFLEEYLKLKSSTEAKKPSLIQNTIQKVTDSIIEKPEKVPVPKESATKESPTVPEPAQTESKPPT